MKRRPAFALILLAMITVLPSFAQTTDAEAKKWLTKMIEAFSNPYTTTYNMDMDMPTQGMKAKITGKQQFKSPTEMNMKMTMNMEMPQQGSMEMNMNLVMDGKTGWIEMKMPAMGMNQIMKFDLADMEKMSGIQGLSNLKDMDPKRILEMTQQVMAFSYKGKEDGKVILEAQITKEYLERMKAQQVGDMMGTFTYKIDEKQIFPIQFIVDSEEMKLNGDMGDVKPLGADAKFTYTPPEGAQVMDMSAMMNMQQGNQ